MNIAEALQIVIDLAKENALTREVAKIADIEIEFERQQEAIRQVEDLAVNQFGDD